MECKIWDEMGLLYISGELDKSEIKDIEGHFAQCNSCRDQLISYQTIKKTYFISEFFDENTSDYIDQRILQVCTSTQSKPVFLLPFFSFQYQKVIIPLILLLVGFSGGIYFSTIRIASKDIVTSNSDDKLLSTTSKQLIKERLSTVTSDFDSNSKYNYSDSFLLYSQDTLYQGNRGNLELQGVVPVDLLNK